MTNQIFAMPAAAGRRGSNAVHTALCDTVGIEYPIFAFTHCRDVVVAVSGPAGSACSARSASAPSSSRSSSNWMDEHVDGKPYGVDVVMPQKSLDVHGSDRAGCSARSSR